MINARTEYYRVVWDEDEPWTGDPYPFPQDKKFTSKKDAIEYANKLKNGDEPLLHKSTIKVEYHYCIQLDPKKYRNPYKWITEPIKWE